MGRMKDRVMLGALAGVAGNLAKTFIDELSIRLGISQRPFRMTASGVWVSTVEEARNLKGQTLGTMFDFGLAGLGGVGLVYLLTRTGRDHYLTKGLLYGLSFGSAINAMLSGLAGNRVRPKDAASNMSYLVSHAAYGLVAATAAAHLGHPSLFDVAPAGDYLAPTTATTEERRRAAVRRARGRRAVPRQAPRRRRQPGARVVRPAAGRP